MRAGAASDSTSCQFPAIYAIIIVCTRLLASLVGSSRTEVCWAENCVSPGKAGLELIRE